MGFDLVPAYVQGQNEFLDLLYKFVIQDRQYVLLLTGLRNTLFIALVAAVWGILIGSLISILRYICTDVKNPVLRTVGGAVKLLCDGYVTVIRGTPVMVQLLIWATVVLVFMRDTLPIACIAFSINSGAYVAEIMRAGIEAVDIGQTEAGRSLGLSRLSTMLHIVLPQAFKNVLPALGNEFIILLKETSVAGYVAVRDLTGAANTINNKYYDGRIYMLIAVVYLILVFGLTRLLRILERRLARSDRG